MPVPIAAGDVRSYSRTFTAEDVRRFAEVSGDRGQHHVEPDASGRLWVHGLLTATIPTKLGGDLNYLAQTMNFEFLRPVFSGDTITCESRCTRADAQAGRTLCAFEIVLTNQHGKEVLRATTTGVILAS
jgi:3-hydroxybutyryl-CoA dehydratase